MSEKKKSIIFGITSLQLGGAERVLVDLSNELCKKYDITIFCIYDNGELKSELNRKIKFKSLYSCKYGELTRIKKIWVPIRILLFSKFIYNMHIKQECDIEIAFLEGPITRLFSSKNGNTRKFAWIHNDIRSVFGKGFKAKLKRWVDKKTYEKFDKLVFVSKENMKNFEEQYNSIDSRKLKVIYNYINKDLILKKSVEHQNVLGDRINKKIVSVCRLVEQKAIDRFIRVHHELIRNGYKHKVYIIGDGPQRRALQEIIKEENVSDSFFLLGKKENPYPYIREADYFCLLSYFEGYGMVLEEAKILNKEIIITDTAAREAIQGYSKAIILENNQESIYEGLYKILSSESDNMVDNNYKYDNKERLQEVIDFLEK